MTTRGPVGPPRNLFRGHDEVVVGKAIIALNVVLFVVSMIGGADLEGHGGRVYEDLVLWGPFIYQGEWWRLVTGAFMHAGIVHLGMNMLLLWFLAQEMEWPLGRSQFAATYAVSVIGGSLGVILLSPISPTLGASGGVFGLMGALVVLQIRAKQNPWNSGIGGLVVLNLLLTFAVPGISAGGHLGGLLAGAIAGAVVEPIPWARRAGTPRSSDPRLRAAVLLALAVLLGVAAVMAADWLVPGAMQREYMRRLRG